MKKCICLWFLLCITPIVQAADDPAPLRMLKMVTTELAQALEANRADIQSDPNRLRDYIETIVLPHVDFQYMAKWVLGRAVWNDATPAQQQAFTQAFRQLLIRTYTGVVLEYVDEEIEYFPIRGEIGNKKRIQVHSRITQAGSEPVDVVYRLLLKSDGQWLLYDFVIEGVSLLKGFQSQFAQQSRHDGLDVLIESMNTHNDTALFAPAGEEVRDEPR